MMPGQIVLTRTPMTERSLAAGTVIPMLPPLDAEYASWPVWPSIPATDAVLMTTPRCPSSSAGSVRAIAAAAIRIRLNVPIRLMSKTLRNVARLCGAPSRFTVRSAQPMPAQFTTVRSGAPVAVAAPTAAATDASSDTSVLTNSPPVSSATVLPRSSFRSAMTTALPAAASARAVASPRPLAPPEMIAAVPLSSMAGSILGGPPPGPAGRRKSGTPAGHLSVPRSTIRAGRPPPPAGAADRSRYILKELPSSGKPVITGGPLGRGTRQGETVKKFRGNPWAVLLVVSLGFFMTLLDLTIVNIAIPDMLTRLHASLDDILWVINAYALVLAVLVITAGRLGDRIGPRPMFTAGIAVFTAAPP